MMEADPNLWHSRLIRTDVRKHFFYARGQNVNKATDREDCPQLLKDIWAAHEGATVDVTVSESREDLLSEDYLLRHLAKGIGTIRNVLYDVDIKSWRGHEGKVVIVCPFVDREGFEPLDVESPYLNTLLSTMESREGNSCVAHNLGVFIANEEGFLNIHNYLT